MFGLDLLGVAAFPKAFYRAFPKGFAVGVFASTFGDPYPKLRRILNTGKCPRVRVHAIWEDSHRYVPRRHDPLIREEHEKLKKFAKSFPGIDFQFSPFCEVHGDLTNILQELKEHTPFTLVNSVWQGPMQKPRLAINEVHGSHAKTSGAYNYSWDGDSTVDGDVTQAKRVHKGAMTHFFWHPSFNGRRNVQDSTPRPERRFWPTAELIQSIAYLANQKGRTNLRGNDLWKSHADVHSVPPEPRAYKPVLLIDVKADYIDLQDRDGKTVERLAYGGPFSDGSGRHRYYANRYGYQIAEEACKRTGTPVCQFLDRKVNPAFRDGSFR